MRDNVKYVCELIQIIFPLAVVYGLAFLFAS